MGKKRSAPQKEVQDVAKQPQTKKQKGSIDDLDRMKSKHVKKEGLMKAPKAPPATGPPKKPKIETPAVTQKKKQKPKQKQADAADDGETADADEGAEPVASLKREKASAPKDISLVKKHRTLDAKKRRREKAKQNKKVKKAAAKEESIKSSK